MKYIIIDDNTKYAEKLLAELKEEGEVISSESYVLNELANKINVKAKNEIDTVLLININLKAKNSNRQEQKGIELLIWLRIKEILNHVVLYSFETLHSLLNRNPKHLITTSQGTTFVQLPDAFKDLQNNLSKKQEDKTKYLADPDNVRETLKPAFSIEKFRHREANWWGVKQLWDINNSIYDLNDKYPSDIEENLKKLENYIAKALYEYNDMAINKGLEELLTQKSSDKNNKIDLEVQGRMKRMRNLENEISNSNLTGKEEERKQDEIKRIKNSISKLESEKKENIRIDKTLFIQELVEIKRMIKEGNPAIMYIDDNAEKGWADVILKMLGNVTIESIVPIEKYKNRIKEFFIEIVKPLLPGNFTLIILDLRLYDEIGVNLSPEKLSGSLLLNEIQVHFPDIPILVITASNKAAAYKTLITLGADAFWTKEGIDEHKMAVDSISSYKQFIDFVQKLHSKEYLYLRKLLEIEKKCNGNLWWCDHKWINGDETKVNINDVNDVVRQIAKLYKAFLHRFYINEDGNIDERVFFLTSLINKIGLIVELIHGMKIEGSDKEKSREKFKELSSAIQMKRIDTLGFKIREYRNQTSHAFALSSTIDIFFEVVDILNEYLPKSNEYSETEIKGALIKDYNKTKVTLLVNDQKYII